MKKIVLSLNRKLIENNLLFTFKNVSKYYWNKDVVEQHLNRYTYADPVLRHNEFINSCFEFRYYTLIQKLFNDRQIFLSSCEYAKLKLIKKYINKVDEKTKIKGFYNISTNSNMCRNIIKINPSDTLKVLKFFIEEQKMDIHQNEYPFAGICARGDLRSAKYLISKGAKPDGINSSKYPLFQAISNGNLDMVKYLIFKGAKPDNWCIEISNIQSCNKHVYNHLNKLNNKRQCSSKCSIF